MLLSWDNNKQSKQSIKSIFQTHNLPKLCFWKIVELAYTWAINDSRKKLLKHSFSGTLWSGFQLHAPYIHLILGILRHRDPNSFALKYFRITVISLHSFHGVLIRVSYISTNRTSCSMFDWDNNHFVPVALFLSARCGWYEWS